MIEIKDMKLVSKPDDEYVYIHMNGIVYVATADFLRDTLMYYISKRVIKPFDDFLYEQTINRKA